MAQIVEETRALPASKKVININRMTIIPNSQAEFCIYSYRAEVETHFDLKDEAFFNPAYTCLRIGDIVRIFRFEKQILANYYEFIVTNVDKINKKVETITLVEKNIKKIAGDK